MLWLRSPGTHRSGADLFANGRASGGGVQSSRGGRAAPSVPTGRERNLPAQHPPWVGIWVPDNGPERLPPTHRLSLPDRKAHHTAPGSRGHFLLFPSQPKRSRRWVKTTETSHRGRGARSQRPPRGDICGFFVEAKPPARGAPGPGGGREGPGGGGLRDSLVTQMDSLTEPGARGRGPGPLTPLQAVPTEAWACSAWVTR